MSKAFSSPPLGRGILEDAFTEVYVCEFDAFERIGSAARQDRQQMKLAAHRIFQSRELFEPDGQVGRPEGRVTTPLGIPINGKGRVLGREAAASLAGVVVNGTEAAHGAVGDRWSIDLANVCSCRSATSCGFWPNSDNLRSSQSVSNRST